MHPVERSTTRSAPPRFPCAVAREGEPGKRRSAPRRWNGDGRAWPVRNRGWGGCWRAGRRACMWRWPMPDARDGAAQCGGGGYRTNTSAASLPQCPAVAAPLPTSVARSAR